MADELSHHDVLELVAGDSWTITGTLLTAAGAAFDLTNAVILWTLRGPDGETLEDLVAVSVVVIVQPPTLGKITIAVPKGASAGLAAGRYHDAIRVFVGDTEASTMWVGPIDVTADPWELEEA